MEEKSLSNKPVNAKELTNIINKVVNKKVNELLNETNITPECIILLDKYIDKIIDNTNTFLNNEFKNINEKMKIFEESTDWNHMINYLYSTKTRTKDNLSMNVYDTKKSISKYFQIKKNCNTYYINFQEYIEKINITRNLVEEEQYIYTSIKFDDFKFSENNIIFLKNLSFLHYNYILTKLKKYYEKYDYDINIEVCSFFLSIVLKIHDEKIWEAIHRLKEEIEELQYAPPQEGGLKFREAEKHWNNNV